MLFKVSEKQPMDLSFESVVLHLLFWKGFEKVEMG